MNNDTYPLKKTARIAGFLFLVWIITGLFGLMYIPAKIRPRAAWAAGLSLTYNTQSSNRGCRWNHIVWSRLAEEPPGIQIP